MSFPPNSFSSGQNVYVNISTGDVPKFIADIKSGGIDEKQKAIESLTILLLRYANIAPKLLEQGILEALVSVLTEGFDKALYLSCNQLLAILSSTLLSNDTETSCQQIMGNLLEMMTPSNDQLNRSALRAGKIISTSSSVAGKTLREAALAKGFVDILDGELRLKENPPETLVEAIGCISGLFRMKVKKEEMIQLKGPLDQLAHGEDNLVGEAAGGVMARYMHDVSSSSHRRRKRHRNGVANEWDMINDDSQEEESSNEQGPFNDVQFQLEQTMRSIKGINTSTRSRHSPSSPHRRNRFEPVVLPSLTVYDDEPRRDTVEIKFAYGSLPITELANRCSKRVGDYKWSTVVVDHTVTQGIAKCVFRSHGHQVSMIVGVVDDQYRIRDNQQLGKVEHTLSYRANGGSISHSDDFLDSNTSWGENDEISIIIDMTRHCLYFQKNGELQPIGVRNIPHSLRFAFDLYWENDTCEVLSLEYLTEPAFQKLMKSQKVTLKDWR